MVRSFEVRKTRNQDSYGALRIALGREGNFQEVDAKIWGLEGRTRGGAPPAAGDLLEIQYQAEDYQGHPQWIIKEFKVLDAAERKRYLEAFALPEDNRLACVKPVTYQLRATRIPDGLVVTGRLAAVLNCRCDRCLTPFARPLSVPEVCHYYEALTEDRVDLTDDLREDLAILFPDKILCADDCRGLCPQCGRNRNVADCGCQAADPGPEAWDKLDGLHL
jgi:uncharacterized protein